MQETELTNFLTTKLSELTEIPINEVDVNKAIIDMGLNSFLAAELNAALQEKFNVELPFMAVTQGASTKDITRELCSEN